MKQPTPEESNKIRWGSLIKRGLTTFLADMFVLAVIIALLIVASMLIKSNVHSGLESYSDSDFNWQYTPPFPPFDPAYINYTILLDGHTHTTYSDGDLTPKQMLEWHIANGYNAVVVTDHNNLEGATVAREIARQQFDDKIKVIIGMEYSCCRIHMNLIGITTPIVPSQAFPTDEELQAAINQTHAQGGIVSVNHIPWSLDDNTLPDHPTIQQLYDWGVDYVEAVWADLFDYQDYLFALKNGMGVISGTDMHSPGRGVNGWTTIIANFTEDAIFQQLKQKNTSLIYNAIDSPYLANPQNSPKNLILSPFFQFTDFLSGFYYDHSGMYSFTGAFCEKKVEKIYWDIVFTCVSTVANPNRN